MKTALRYLIISFLLVLISCSSDKEPIIYYNKINCNGIQVLDASAENLETSKTEDFIKVGCDYYTESPAEFHRVILIFDKYGNLGFASDVNVSTNSAFGNFAYNSAEHFNFQLEEFDEAKGTVKGNYSGKLYSDPKDLNSDFINLEGSFYLKVFEQSNGEVTRPLLNLKMNNIDWRPTRQLDYQFPYEGTPDGRVTQFVSDDPFKLVIGYLLDNQEQMHSFDNTNTDFFVRLGKYNPVTNQFDYYTTSLGTINITDAGYGPFSGGYLCKGTFSLTATNPIVPFDTITITDGNFNILP